MAGLDNVDPPIHVSLGSAAVATLTPMTTERVSNLGEASKRPDRPKEIQWAQDAYRAGQANRQKSRATRPQNAAAPR